jgi:CBS domain-containing protein
MKIRDVLTDKGSTVVTIGPDVTVQSAVQVLVEHNIGAVVVLDGSEIAGILSERDILRLTAANPDHISDLPVRDVMTRDVITGTPDEEIGHVMELMTDNRIRHLPVLGDSGLAGILSIGDVVNALLSEVKGENRYMREYIQGRA